MTHDVLYNIECSIPEIPRYCNQTVQPLKVISEKRYKGVPPTIVVEVLKKHHMIITYFHIPAPGMGSLLRVFFWERRLEKGNGVRHLLGRWSQSCRGQEA